MRGKQTNPWRYKRTASDCTSFSFMNNSQGLYWLLTIPHADFLPWLPPGVQWIKGQLEQGADTGYLHWQLVVALSSKSRLAGLKRIFGTTVHAELSRSAAAESYVWKDETAVEGTRFELGQRKIKRNSQVDWDIIRDSATAGRLVDIPADIYVRYYGNLRRIATDHLAPDAMVREVQVYWGATGTGKSRRAWDEASWEAYPKDPRTKFWDGYRGQDNVVIDEFRGDVAVGHLLRWFDRYPVNVEVKGSAVPLTAKKIWITSNLSPDEWYPGLDAETLAALKRRLNIVHFPATPFTE